MAERFKAAVLKTVDVRASVGSNPTFSVFSWRDGREAEGASLLRKYTGNGIGGSNPPLSVFLSRVPIAQLDRVSDCGSEGRRFKSSWAYFFSQTPPCDNHKQSPDKQVSRSGVILPTSAGNLSFFQDCQAYTGSPQYLDTCFLGSFLSLYNRVGLFK